MIRFIVRQIRERPGRSMALGVGIVVSSVAFVLLVVQLAPES
jgi:hypothetical protein